MSINRKRFGALLCVVAIGIAVASTAGAASDRSETIGITPTTVTIGGTFPLTGPASLYKTIPAAEQAYYGWVNAHGGVRGRMINDIVVDDQYDPAQTVPAVKDLVENQGVFGIVGSLGTAPGLATWVYLNNKHVPQVLLATGDSYWGMCMASGAFKPQPYCQTPKPWTIGWQPDYPGEARLYGRHILSHQTNPTIGILYQNDAYGQNYRTAFRKVFANHGVLSDIVDEESYNVGDSASVIGAHVAAIQGHGANTFVIFATPTASIQALAAQHALGFASATTYLNNVSANRVFLKAAEGAGATPDGVISTTYIKSNTVSPDNPGMQLAHDIIYATGNATLEARFDNGDSNLIYGLASAWTFVDALRRAGADPTRSSFMKAIRTLNENPSSNTNPFVYPGIKVYTDSLRTFPMEQLQFQRWDAGAHPAAASGPGDWDTFGPLYQSGK